VCVGSQSFPVRGPHLLLVHPFFFEMRESTGGTLWGSCGCRLVIGGNAPSVAFSGFSFEMSTWGELFEKTLGPPMSQAVFTLIDFLCSVVCEGKLMIGKEVYAFFFGAVVL